jgi:CRP/FNR family transcriptional regulator
MADLTIIAKQGAESRAAPRAAVRRGTRFNLHETCLSDGVPAEDLERFDNIVFVRRLVRAGERLFGPGDPFTCIYSIRCGFFKTSLVDGEGREQVTGFFMADELLGMDGMGGGRHNVCAVALESSEVWAMPHGLIEAMAREVPSLQRRLHSALAGEIARSQGVMMLLGSMSARERIAAFLLNLSKRFVRRGYSGSTFQLRMTRADLGSYLGLSLETVSRLLSALQRDRLMDVRKRDVSILDMGGLERILRSDGAASSAPPMHLRDTGVA